MTKKSKLLFVIAIIMIIFAAIGLISGFSAAALYGAMGLGGYAVMSVLPAIVELVAGIVGVASKSKGLIMVFGIIVIVLQIISLVMAMRLLSVFGASVSPLTIIGGFILPILYIIGAAMSK